MPIPPDPLVGAVLGERYEVLRPISWGGMDDVYEAADHILERRVAVRLYPTASPEDRARFEEESRILTERDLPRVYDTGPHGDATYLVFELADGDPATDRDATVAMPPVVPLPGSDPTGEVTTILASTGATDVLPAALAGEGAAPVPRRSRELPLWGAVLGLAAIFAIVLVFALTRAPAGAPTPTTVVTVPTTVARRVTTTTATTEVPTTIPTTTSEPDTSSSSIDSTTSTLVTPTSGLGLSPAQVKEARRAARAAGD